jgi:hypothetical protein
MQRPSYGQRHSRRTFWHACCAERRVKIDSLGFRRTEPNVVVGSVLGRRCRRERVGCGPRICVLKAREWVMLDSEAGFVVGWSMVDDQSCNDVNAAQLGRLVFNYESFGSFDFARLEHSLFDVFFEQNRRLAVQVGQKTEAQTVEHGHFC